eukprot:CAMPEP_0181471652 /NCGR_PEP_ID=MMETSP1110-20121109/39187_1 /TAXON_ID=174948 /ORGANISM="Symbiodinium sp., Strain CCMP421" /LENGTH=90 /DNA_ID=CAMNT_0023596681 /DNA_START=220 /DNA_END=492 /DNA_ORIENTATION=+
MHGAGSLVFQPTKMDQRPTYTGGLTVGSFSSSVALQGQKDKRTKRLSTKSASSCQSGIDSADSQTRRVPGESAIGEFANSVPPFKTTTFF